MSQMPSFLERKITIETVKVALKVKVGGGRRQKKTKIAGRFAYSLVLCLADDEPEAGCPELKFIIDSDSTEPTGFRVAAGCRVSVGHGSTKSAYLPTGRQMH